MNGSNNREKAQAAWDRIEALGGEGVWEREDVVVSFSNTKITDGDLILFRDFPFVQILDLSDTKITDEGLAHLDQLPALEVLIVANSRISERALKEFQNAHPSVKVTTGPPPTGAINPFTGEPF